MYSYQSLGQQIFLHGNDRGDRTNTGTISIFGAHWQHNLKDGFPLLTTKKLSFKNIVTELLWFLRGDTNIKYLLENGNHIWTDDAYRVYKRRNNGTTTASKDMFECEILSNPVFAQTWGDLGPVYGKQWRQWMVVDRNYVTDHPIDQITKVIESIKTNPEGRRHIVTAWNPAEVDSMALPPCHCLFQFYVRGNELDCHLYQRSADYFLGVPYNIASYALLTEIIARECGLSAGKLHISFGDLHIYNNHIDQVRQQLLREPRALPILEIRAKKRFDEYEYEDFAIIGYDPRDLIKADLNVGV